MLLFLSFFLFDLFVFSLSPVAMGAVDDDSGREGLLRHRLRRRLHGRLEKEEGRMYINLY